MTLLERIETSQSLIEQADIAYAEGDSGKAVQKAWESARQALSAIAERRGWKSDTAKDIRRAAYMLYKEEDRKEIYTLFVVAFITPYNFEEGWLTDNYIRHDIQDVKKLLAILQDIE